MRVPTQGETYAKIIDHLRKLQEETAMMAHLLQAQDDRGLANSWLAVSENFKKMQRNLTLLAMGRMQ
jgi:hypothetical protein